MAKRKRSKEVLCPCGSGLVLSRCCGRYLTNGTEYLAAPTPQALMRSRYAAFSLGDEPYLLATWDKAHRPERIFEPEEVPLKWFSLKILSEEVASDGRSGTVEFVAKARSTAGAIVHHEKSRFDKGDDDKWRYVDGDIVEC